MKVIKTIIDRLDNAKEFDKAVNEAIENGFELKKRKVLIPFSQDNDYHTFIMLYAELEAEKDGI